MAFLRNKLHDKDPLWHVQLTMVLAIGLQLALPERYVISSRLLVPLLELLLLMLLMVTTPKDKIFVSLQRRLNVLLLIGVTGASNLYALAGVVQRLLQQGHISNGRELVIAAVNIYLTNIIIFALLYWEIDGGGPGQRHVVEPHERDFLFPQSNLAGFERWKPTFIDYLYVSSTNGMAFSPTDTMPLSRRAKVLMLLQATASLLVVALVAARAVNILN